MIKDSKGNTPTFVFNDTLLWNQFSGKSVKLSGTDESSLRAGMKELHHGG